MALSTPTTTDQISTNPVPPAETPGLSGLLTLAVAVVVVAALYVGREVFIPIVLAILLSFVIAPLVALLRKAKLPRVVAVTFAVLFALGVISGLATIVGTQLAQLATELPQYQSTFTRKIGDLRQATIGGLTERLSALNRQIQRATTEGPAVPASPSTPGEAKPVQVEVRTPDPSPMDIARATFAAAVKPLTETVIILVAAIFILLQREDLRNRMIRLFGSKDLHRTTLAMDDAARRLSRFFLLQVALNFCFGVMIAVGLYFIGVPSPLFWGLVAMLMRFVPYIGGFIAGIGPVLLAAAVDPGWSMAIYTALLFVVLEPLMGHAIEPTVYGHSTGMSPFAVVVSAIFWTWLWGPIGLLLSTPFTLCLVVLGRHIEKLEFFDVLLGDRPALTPVEIFYQRMLAGDPDEAEDQAELLLKDRSLSSYYDEVALKGLQLAANDAKRGVLSARKLESIRSAMMELVSDLSSYDDIDPKSIEHRDDDNEEMTTASERDRDLPTRPALQENAEDIARLPAEWRRDGAILCVAGRGVLDEGVAAMLAQLLEKHGFGARVVPHHEVSRSRVMSLDVDGVVMVCVSYLEISGNPAYLRYLMRRLRQRVGKRPILVGLWPAEAEVLQDEGLKSQIGADYYVTTLREALRACLTAAYAAAGMQPEAINKATLAPDARGVEQVGPRPDLVSAAE